MRRLRLLLLVTGAGAVLTGLPSFALTSPNSGEGVPMPTASADAVRLLEDAARASRSLAWSGVQHVVSVRDGQPSFTVLQVQHTPGTGSAARVLNATDDQVGVPSDVLDTKLLSLLAGRYDLGVAGESSCVGRRAVVVEARRPGVPGPAGLAGRFWLDRETHLVMRREVLDRSGSVIRSSAFVEMTMGVSPVAQAVDQVRSSGQRLDDDGLRAMQDKGWPVVQSLPDGLELFEARLRDTSGADVLQLSYSDGLSTLSLFVQEGELASDPAGTAHSVGLGTVWVSKGSPERVVWSGDGRTWTLVSDAPAAVVADAVLLLPHSRAAAVEDGIGSRVWRGMSRVGGWLNPFG